MRDPLLATSMREETAAPSREQHNVADDEREEPRHNGKRPTDLVQLRRPVHEANRVGTRIDGEYVTPHFYDSFNYSLLTGSSTGLKVAVGITSANPREGKTLVACNLAVSLTVAHQKKTVLVDLNLRDPRLHKVFGVPQSPGLLDGMAGGPINVTPTQVNGLFVLSAGAGSGRFAGVPGGSNGDGTTPGSTTETSLQIEQVAVFRDIIYSLKEHFDFVIVDMPAVNDYMLPLLYANQLDGTLLVVRGGKTKQAEVDRAMQMLNEHRVLGFVFNGVEGGTVQRKRNQ